MSDNKIEVEVSASARELRAGMADASRSIGETMSQIRGQFDGLRTSLMGIGAAFAAAFAGSKVREAITETVKLTQGAIDMGRQLGISATQASILKVALGDAYVSEQAFQTGAQRLTTTLRSNEKAITDLGVKTRDQNGHYRSTVELMADVNAALMTLKAGTDRNIAGQVVYGRGWAEIQDVLRLTPQVMADAEEKARSLGLAVGEEGVQQVTAYRSAMNDLGDVMTAMKVQIGNALLPIVTSFTNHMAGQGAEGMMRFRTALGSVLVLFTSLKTVLVQVYDFFKVLITGMVVGFATIGSGLNKLLHLDFAGAASSLKDGFAQLREVGTDYWAEAKADWAAGQGQMADIMESTFGPIGGKDTKAPGAGRAAPSAAGSATKGDPLAEHRRIAEYQMSLLRRSMQEERALLTQASEHKRRLAQQEVDLRADSLAQMASLGQITRLQELSGLQQLEAERFRIDREALREKASDSQAEIIDRQRALQELELLEGQHRERMRQLGVEAQAERMRPIQEMFGNIRAGFQSTIQGVLNGTTTIKNGLRQMAATVAGAITEMLARIAAQWLTVKLMSLLFSKSTIAGKAAEAGAGGVASMAAAPFPLNLGAPAFGAAMAALAASYLAIPAAAQGWDIPRGIDPVVQAHGGEMILPAKHADVIRGLSEGGGAARATTHNHTWNVNAVDARSFEQYLRVGGLESILREMQRGR